MFRKTLIVKCLFFSFTSALQIHVLDKPLIQSLQTLKDHFVANIRFHFSNGHRKNKKNKLTCVNTFRTILRAKRFPLFLTQMTKWKSKTTP